MLQDYKAYTATDHSVWKQLFERQAQILSSRACNEYLDCLAKLKPVFHGEAIPCIAELNDYLLSQCGWQIKVVKGLIPVEEFFQLLASRQFPSSTWLRNEDQLDYLEEPDMFHDLYGHIPLLLNEPYAHFMQQFGELGASFIGIDPIIRRLQTLYWFTIEFGLIRQDHQTRIYGAGILSSAKESIFVLEAQHLIQPFSQQAIVNTEYDISDIQETYFSIESFDQLYDCLEELVLPEALV